MTTLVSHNLGSCAQLCTRNSFILLFFDNFDSGTAHSTRYKTDHGTPTFCKVNAGTHSGR
jgi:hypothetical protein